MFNKLSGKRITSGRWQVSWIFVFRLARATWRPSTKTPLWRAYVRPSVCLSRRACTPSDSPGGSTENAAGGEMYRTCLMQADGLSGVVPHLGPAVADRQQSADEGTPACTSEAASPHLTGITTNRSGSSLLAAASGSGQSAAVGTTRTPNTSDLRVVVRHSGGAPTLRRRTAS